MDPIETLVRDVLREHAGAAPTVVPQLRSRPLRRWLYPAAAAALVAILAGTVGVLRDGGPTARPAGLPAGYKWVSYHGISVAVPKNLSIDSAVCGPIPNSVVEYDPDAAAASCASRPPRPPAAFGTLVYLQPSAVASQNEWRPAKGRVSKRVIVDAAGVTVRVEANAAATVDSVVSSVQITPVDHLGCTAVRPTFASPVYVGTPTSAVVCDYVNSRSYAEQWLRGSGRAGADEVQVLARMATASPERPNVPPIVVRFGYPDGSVVLAAVSPGPVIDSVVR